MKKRKIQKITIIRLIKTIVFFALLFVMAEIFSYMLLPKRNDMHSGILNPNARGFYGEPENSIEIAVIGNSDAYSGFSPVELWNSYGYTSYVAAEGAQNIGESVNILKEILTCQSPELVILEVDCLWAGNSTVGQLEDNMKSILYDLLPLYRYHDRWKTVSRDELFAEPDYVWSPRAKGQWLSSSVSPYTGENVMVPTEERCPIPKANLYFLNTMLKICEENDIQVLLVALPSCLSWNYEKHNALADFAEERGLPYIDMNTVEGEYAVDWSQDTRDGGKHLNSYGASKVTAYIGAFVAEHYELEDRRGDAAYEDWNQCYQYYCNYMNK